MTSAQAIALTSEILAIDSEISGPMLLIVNAAFKAKGDPMEEKMVQDVMRLLYSRTEHSEQSMLKFISEGEEDSTHLAA